MNRIDPFTGEYIGDVASEIGTTVTTTIEHDIDMEADDGPERAARMALLAVGVDPDDSAMLGVWIAMSAAMTEARGWSVRSSDPANSVTMERSSGDTFDSITVSLNAQDDCLPAPVSGDGRVTGDGPAYTISVCLCDTDGVVDECSFITSPAHARGHVVDAEPGAYATRADGVARTAHDDGAWLGPAIRTAMLASDLHRLGHSSANPEIAELAPMAARKMLRELSEGR